MPALAASSPFLDGRPSGLQDNRLDVYRRNARQLPRVTGLVIPEPVFSREAYQQEFATEFLHAMLLNTIRDAERAEIEDGAYAGAFGWDLAAGARCTAGQLWGHLHRQLYPPGSLPPQISAALETLLREGTLATRILRSLDDPQPDRIRKRYRRLCACLEEGRMYACDKLIGEQRDENSETR